RHTRSKRDWSSDVCSSDLPARGLGDRELIEVPRVVVVDGGPEEVAEIVDGGVAVVGRPRDRARLGKDRGGEVRLEPALDHHPPGDPPELAPMPVTRHRRKIPRFVNAWQASLNLGGCDA